MCPGFLFAPVSSLRSDCRLDIITYHRAMNLTLELQGNSLPRILSGESVKLGRVSSAAQVAALGQELPKRSLASEATYKFAT